MRCRLANIEDVSVDTKFVLEDSRVRFYNTAYPSDRIAFYCTASRTKQKSTVQIRSSNIKLSASSTMIDLGTTVSEGGLAKGRCQSLGHGRRGSRYTAFSLYVRHCPSPWAKLLPKGRHKSVGGGVYDVGGVCPSGGVCAQ
jgi:hypothetical protein